MGCALKRILQFQQAVKFGPIQVIDDKNVDVAATCMYSWSSDGVCWTSWTTYENYLKIAKNIESDFFLRVLLFGGFDRISLNGLFTKCYTIVLDSTNPFLTDFCGNENLFNPYCNLDCALLLQEQLANSIICMFGIPIYYFRVAPDVKTADYTFKEFVLHNVVDVKQIKLMLQDGQMPSSNPRFTELDFDWQTDWEVEVGKRQFAQAFGDTAFPKQRDFIYIPMMKRMWSVNSAYDEKNEGLLWRPTTWKLALVKYNELTNVNTDNVSDAIDSWLTNKYEDTFGKLEDTEQKRESGTAQLSAPTHASTNLFNIFMEDAVRQAYTKNDIAILAKQYNQKSNVIARNIYRFLNENGQVTYQEGYCGESGMLSFILETPGSTETAREIVHMGNVGVQLEFLLGSSMFNLKFGGCTAELEPFNTYLVVCQWNRATFSTELKVFKYTHEGDIPIYKLRPEMYWFDLDNPICDAVGEYNNDFRVESKQPCYISGYPCMMTNIKLYNRYMGEDATKEAMKYLTQNESCVFSDQARPIDSGQGFAVR